MNTRMKLLAGLATAGAFSISALSIRGAGPLAPPGAPAPTMKSLDEIDAKLEKRTPISSLPFTITASGSYYVTGHLTGTASQHGISIDASDVTLDLGGFTLTGPTTDAATHAVRIIAGRSNVVVRDGIVRNWVGGGIIAESVTSKRIVVEGLTLSGPDGIGISLGSHSTARDCMVELSGNTGISTGISCQIIDCRVVDTGGSGIVTGNSSTLINCTAVNAGQAGISVGSGSTLIGCLSTECTGSGFALTSQSSVQNCTSDNNGSDGFSGLLGNTLSGCAAKDNAANGFTFTTNCTLDGCTAASNQSNGINTGEAASIRGCTARANGGSGITVGNGSVIADCAATINTGTNGISAGSGCTLSGCSAVSNTGTNGISAGSGCTLTACSVRGSLSSAASSAGISTDIESTVTRCTVTDTGSTAGTLTSTTGVGISVGAASTVEACIVQGSTADGIRVTSSCRIFENNCVGNGAGAGIGAGIHTTGQNNRIESNSINSNDRGIDVDSEFSLIIRNSAAGNTINYDIAANNRYGPIIDIRATGTAAVSGNSAATTLATAEPNANFTH